MIVAKIKVTSLEDLERSETLGISPAQNSDECTIYIKDSKVEYFYVTEEDNEYYIQTKIGDEVLPLIYEEKVLNELKTLFNGQ